MGRPLTVEAALAIVREGADVLRRASSGTWDGRLPQSLAGMDRAVDRLEEAIQAARSLSLSGAETQEKQDRHLARFLKEAAAVADSSLLDHAWCRMMRHLELLAEHGIEIDR